MWQGVPGAAGAHNGTSIPQACSTRSQPCSRTLPMAGAQGSHEQGTPHVPAPSLPDPALVLPLPLPHPPPACSDLVPSAPALLSRAHQGSPQEPWLHAPLTATLLQLPEPAGAEEPPDQPKRPPRIRWARWGPQAQPPPALPRPVPTLGLCREQGLGSASHTPQPGCSRVTSDLERAHGGCAGCRPGARHCPGISPRPGCSHPALPQDGASWPAPTQQGLNPGWRGAAAQLPPAA